MKLGRRVLGLFICLTIALVCVLFVAAHSIVRGGFRKIEDDLAVESVLRVRKAILGRAEDLDTSVADWSRWDDTYRFVRDRNARYVAANLSSDTFKGLKLHLLLITDLQGRAAWGGISNPPGSPLRPPPEDLLQLARPGTPLTRFGTLDDRCTGIVLTGNGPMLVASRPILTTDAKGPARGTLLMGRLLGADALRDIEDDVGVGLAAHLLTTSHARMVLARRGGNLRAGDRAEATVLDRNTIAGYAVMPDVYGRPALLLEARVDRAAYRHGVRTAVVFGGLMAIACVLYAIGFAFSLKTQVIARVASLSEQVAGIEGASPGATRVTLAGGDEMAALANSINGMLERVDAAQRQTDEARRQYQTLFDEIPAGCAVHEMIYDDAGAPADYRFVMVNAAFEALTGLRAEEITGRTVLEVLPATERYWIDTYGRVVETGEHAQFEQHSGSFGRTYRVSAFRPAPGRFACVFWDVTESRAAEEQIRRMLAESNQARVALLSVLEDQRAAAAALSASESEAQQLLAQQTAITTLALDLEESLSVVDTYRTLHKHIRELVEVYFFVVSAYDETDRVIRAEYAAYADKEYDVGAFPPLPLGEPRTGTQSRVVHSGETLYTPDHRQAVAASRQKYTVEDDGSVHREDADEENRDDVTRSVVYLPLKVKGQVTGIMQVQSSRVDAYTERDIALLKGFAGVAAVAVQNARLRAELVRELEERTLAETTARHHVEELERWQDVVLNREDRVQELKREVNELCVRLGESVRYPSQAPGLAHGGPSQET